MKSPSQGRVDYHELDRGGSEFLKSIPGALGGLAMESYLFSPFDAITLTYWVVVGPIQNIVESLNTNRCLEVRRSYELAEWVQRSMEHFTAGLERK